MRTSSLLVLFVLAVASCTPKEGNPEAASSITPDKTTMEATLPPSAPQANPGGKIFVDDPDSRLDLEGLTPPLNERTELLMDGYWEVLQAVNNGDDPRYQDHAGHFFRLLPNGNYVYYKPDGSVLHEGWWHYVRRGNRQHYLLFDALENVNDNEYRFHIQPGRAVLMGTERYNNPGVQLRIDNEPEPPVPVQ